MKKQKSVVECDNEGNDEVFEKFLVEMRRCFKKQEAQMNRMQEAMKLFVRQEIRAALDPKGKKPELTKLSHDSRGPNKSEDKAPVSVKKASKRMSTKRKHWNKKVFKTESCFF